MPEIDWFDFVFMVLGGLGIFLYGIHIMGDSLKLLAGSKFKIIIEKSTNTPLKGILVGIVVTVLLQSSSGTTALTVGLVRAGLMTLPQAVGVIIGSNIGTTATSFLIGLKIKAIALPIMGVGSLLLFFIPRKKIKLFGTVMLGFGMIFYGLDLMGSALKTITEFDGFTSAMLLVENTPVLGVVMGALLTVIVQSSSATIGLLQELFTTGMIPMVGAVAIVLGSNIGTTVTAILAAIGGSTAAKRTATVHVIFNVLGSLLFLILIWPYSYLITYLQEVFLGGVEQEMTISFAHIIFNLFNTIVMFFFIDKLVAISKRIIPGEDFDIVTNVDTLEAHLVTQAPVLALENAKRVIVGMEGIVEKMYTTSVKYSFTNNPKDLELGRRLEEMVDTIDHKVHDYLTKISVSSLDDKSAQNQSMYMDTIRDLERIADHAQNLFDFFEHRYDLKQTLNGEAENSLTTLYDYVYNSIQLAFKAFKDDDEDAASKVLEREEIIDKMVRDYRKQHILRINNNAKLGGDENLFVDILSNVERIGDHCQNIAINILQDSYYPDVVLLKDKNPA